MFRGPSSAITNQLFIRQRMDPFHIAKQQAGNEEKVRRVKSKEVKQANVLELLVSVLKL